MKSKELLLKHLLLNDCKGYVTSDGRLYKAIIDALNEAINYTHSCTELKDKKEMTFKEYLISKGYKLSNNYVWQIDSRDLSNDDIIEQRKQYEYSL